MNKKGFTLAELLGVIVILGILGIIAITAVDQNIKKSRQRTCKTQEKNIIEGAKMWQIDNPGITACVKISVLSDAGYIEEDLINPMTETNYNGDTCVNTNNNTIEYKDEKGCS